MSDTVTTMGKARTALQAGLLMSAMLFAPAAMANSQGEACDNAAGRDGGQLTCDSGLSCAGPFEGTYQQGSCQPPAQISASGQGCDTRTGRPEGQRVCDSGLTCEGPFEGSYKQGTCK